jgi:cysteine desulfurase/selenocysteine lyase
MESSRLYEKSKMSIIKHLGLTTYSEVVFTYNATYAFNLISRSLIKSGKLKTGDKVILSKVDHHANIVPWQILAEEYGIVIDWIDVQSDGTINYDSIVSKIPGSTVLSITGASNVTGEVLDLGRVATIFENLELTGVKKPLFILD